MTAVLWLRRDLRLHDLPALLAAHEGGQVLPVFVVDPALLATAGPVRRAHLVAALEDLRESTDRALVVRTGRPEEEVPRLVRESGAGSVHVSRETTPYGRRRDARVAAALGDVPLVATGTPYAVGPGVVRKADGDPYRVFTPFSRAWRDHGSPPPAPPPARLRWRRGVATEELPGADGPPTHAVGEAAARERWAEFLDTDLARYDTARDRPDLDATSQMSVHLKYGTIHPRTMLADVAAHPAGRTEAARRYVTELCWREFYADVLWHHPASAWSDLNDGLRSMAYEDPAGTPAAHVRAWEEGRTGYPFVDAAMRQLRETGWMHNRARMVVASFLVKDLHVWWPHGARHFLAHLADGDLASNNHGWQWVAGTGTDAAPYFRVFNPVSQGERFDPAGDYVRRHVPELAHVPGAAVHQPWRVPDGLAHGYPERIVDHAAERAEALRRYESARAA
ncbi:deoxyribodipyrimidine photo-lyase [Georgenia sp. 311]|uniref:Deoxyribodipyrimidine photo-lyase n=1 Tax=Georgenia wutianyii TaxID=2585135 RepID=A0ABX5VPX8_9MICO|nr:MULTISPECIES: deoxyribodipyrimidine photo-lyase [Georgenia]QDB80551.1 deoxyribodipyrimidine photo-lyase [Georgenia wutianyii]TNC18238.1 deoxyribodipyrimidine photo-lyase [Georgenia sp. 311]